MSTPDTIDFLYAEIDRLREMVLRLKFENVALRMQCNKPTRKEAAATLLQVIDRARNRQ